MKKLQAVVGMSDDINGDDQIVYGRFVDKDRKDSKVPFCIHCEYAKPGIQTYWCKSIKTITEYQYISFLEMRK